MFLKAINPSHLPCRCLHSDTDHGNCSHLRRKQTETTSDLSLTNQEVEHAAATGKWKMQPKGSDSCLDEMLDAEFGRAVKRMQ